MKLNEGSSINVSLLFDMIEEPIEKLEASIAQTWLLVVKLWYLKPDLGLSAYFPKSDPPNMMLLEVLYLSSPENPTSLRKRE